MVANFSNVVPDNYKELIVNRVIDRLKDPYSIRSASISKPTTGFVGLLNGGTRPIVCIKYNAKNSFGAYIGINEAVFFFKDGRIEGGLLGHMYACANAVYGPFPELENIR